MKVLRSGAAILAALFLCVQLAFARPLDAEIYNGLVYPEMGTIASAMAHRGQSVSVLWHDHEDQVACPRFLLGHSMGGLAALRQAHRCAAAGHPPKAVVLIDPTGYPGAITCPKGVTCLDFYDPSHLVGFGARPVIGGINVHMTGYSHIQLPSVPRVVSGALAATK